MNPIVGHTVVSCYVDAASFLVMILLLLLSERIRKRKTDSLRIFYSLCLVVTFTCICCFTFNAMYGQPAKWCHTVALISRTLWDIFVLGTICLWLAFVDRKLYGKQKTYIRVIRLVPVAVFLILLIVNPFTGIIYTISEHNSLQPKPLFYLMMTSSFLLFLSSALEVWYFDRKSEKIRFLNISPMIISVLVAILPQFFTLYNTGILGYAVGMTLLYFSMIIELRYLDEESGLYNGGFLAHLSDLALVGKNSAHSALILEADGNLPGCFNILRNTLHMNNDVIRLKEKKFLMLSGTDSRSALQLLSTHVEEAVAKHNQEHPDEKVKLNVRCLMRTRDEDVFTFLRTAAEEKDAGDPVRGVVSMISELDRLDKELELAADIQLSALPMNFPPFPEKKEFDLYAFMNPAKEVGGDFYDFFLIDDNHLGLVIADVSGKGVPAALFMMVSKTLIKNQLISGCDPAEALDHVNLQLCERNSSMMFVTVWAAVVEISTGKGIACNAGHENPCIFRAGTSFELLKYKHDTVLGVSKKAKYHTREFELHPGDCVFVYTDGVPEANNVSGKMFGEERLAATLNQDPEQSPKDLIHRLHDAVERFAGGAEQFDDITMLCLKYYGTPKENLKQ